jgi:hypothetical protein
MYELYWINSSCLGVLILKCTARLQPDKGTYWEASGLLETLLILEHKEKTLRQVKMFYQ